MAKVIDSFLVSLGFELDEKTNKEAQQGIDGIRTSALQMGAVLGATFAATTLAIKKNSEQIDEVFKKSKLLGSVSVADLDRFGFAFARAGGSVEDAFSTLSGFEGLLAQADIGEGPFEDLAKAGIDPKLLIDTETSIELLKELASIYPTLTAEQKKLANAALGLNTGAQLLLREGRESLDSLLSKADQLGTISNEMAKNSEDLVDAATNLDRSWSNLVNLFTGAAAPGVTEAINEWADALSNFQSIADSLGVSFGDMFNELAPIAGLLGGGGALAATGAVATKAGAVGTGAALTATGGALATAGILAGTGVAAFGAGSLVNEKVFSDEQRATIRDFVGSRITGAQEILLNEFGPQSEFAQDFRRSMVIHDNKRVDIQIISDNPQEVADKVLEVINDAANQSIQDFNNPIK